MTLSKLTFATAGILIMGISLTACTATNSKPSERSPIATSDCPSLTGAEQSGQDKVTVPPIAQKAPRRKTSSSEPDQDSAGCILVPDA